MTAADLMLLEGDGYRYELIEGELERMSPATPEHAWIGNWFGWRLRDHAETHRFGEVFDSSAGYFFGHHPDTLLAPDVSFVRADRLPPGSDWRAFFEIRPDLVVEIISPSERRAHLDRKIAIDLAAGVRLIWFVDPRRRTITVYAPRPRADRAGRGRRTRRRRRAARLPHDRGRLLSPSTPLDSSFAVDPASMTPRDTIHV